MGYGLTVYTVQLDQLKRAIGSRDAALADAVIEAHRELLEGVDQIGAEAEADGSDPVSFTAADAVRHLIDNQVVAGAPGYVYGYALQAICSHLGEEIDSIVPISRVSEWADDVDAALAPSQLGVTLVDLIYGGSPVKIPEPDDWPGIGFWPPEKVAAAWAVARDIDPATIELPAREDRDGEDDFDDEDDIDDEFEDDDVIEDDLDDDVVETFGQMKAWLQSAAAKPGTAVIGFVS
jgi:hypothetical protein